MAAKNIQKPGIDEVAGISRDFSFDSLTREEQQVFVILFLAPYALNAFEIYRRVVYSFIAENMKNKGQIKIDATKPMWKHDDENPSKAEFMKNVATYEKQTKNRLPTYSLFVRILNEFSKPPFNWIKVRVDAAGKAKALYYLDDAMKDGVKKAVLKENISAGI